MAVYKRNRGFELRTTTWGLSIRVNVPFLNKNFKAGLLIFCAKKSKISRHFQGQIHGKIGRFRGIFTGEKSKFTEKSADFGQFSRKKVKFRRIFRGKFLEKLADFTGNFGKKLRQETISKKQPLSLDFFWQISLKLINFASI